MGKSPSRRLRRRRRRDPGSPTVLRVHTTRPRYDIMLCLSAFFSRAAVIRLSLRPNVLLPVRIYIYITVPSITLLPPRATLLLLYYTRVCGEGTPDLPARTYLRDRMTLAATRLYII